MMHYKTIIAVFLSILAISFQSHASSSVHSTVLTKAAYFAILAEKYPANQFIPAGSSKLSDNALFQKVASNMAQKGIKTLVGSLADSPLTRKEFINITYSFITGKPGKSYIENKIYLKENKIINPRDIGIIRSYEGNVATYRDNSDEAITITGSEAVLFKDTAETDEDSKVEFEFDDLSILTLGEDTVIEISQLVYDPAKNTRRILIKLHEGKLRARVSKTEEKKTNFAIQTPTAVIGVRGTDFRVAYDKRTKKTDVLTFEGLVAVKRFIPSRQGNGEGRNNQSANNSAFESSPDELLIGADDAAVVTTQAVIPVPKMSKEAIAEAKREVVLQDPILVTEGGQIPIEEAKKIDLPTSPVLPPPPEHVSPQDLPPNPPTFIDPDKPKVSPTLSLIDTDGDGVEDSIDILPLDLRYAYIKDLLLLTGAEISNLWNSLTQQNKDLLFAQMSITQIRGLSPAQIVGLTITKMSIMQIQALSTTQIASLTKAQIAQFSLTQLNALTLIQLQALTPSQIGALTATHLTILGFGNLSPAQIAGFTTAQIPLFTIAKVQTLSPTQIQALTDIQIPAFTPNQIAALGLLQIQSITAAQIPFLTKQQIAALTNPQLNAFTLQQVQSITPAQIGALTATQLPIIGFGNLSTAQLNGFTSKQIPLFSLTQVVTLSAAQIQALTATQLPAFTPAQIAALLATQIQAVTANQIPWLTSQQIQALTAVQLTAFTATQIQAVTPAQIAALTLAQIPSTGFTGLSTVQVAAFTPAQIAVFPAAEIKLLTTPQLQALTTEQLQALTAIQLQALSGAQIDALSIAQTQSFTETQVPELILSMGAILKAPNVPNAATITSFLTNLWQKLTTTQQAAYLISQDTVDFQLNAAEKAATINGYKALLATLTAAQQKNLIIESELDMQLQNSDIITVGLGEYFWDTLTTAQKTAFKTEMVAVYNSYRPATMDLLLLRDAIANVLWKGLTPTEKAAYAPNFWASLTAAQKDQFTHVRMRTNRTNLTLQFLAGLTSAQLTSLTTSAQKFYATLTPTNQVVLINTPSPVFSSLAYQLDKDGDGIFNNLDPTPNVTSITGATITNTKAAHTALLLEADIKAKSGTATVVVDTAETGNLIFADFANRAGGLTALSTAADIDSGGFLPFAYDPVTGTVSHGYALQVGSYMTNEAFAAINNSAYLAYAVQVEEDRMNKAVLNELNLTAQTTNTNALAIPASISQLLTASNIRGRDAAFVQNSDAQAGRVLKDAHGNWTRTQQYVLRPNANEIKVVSVSLRPTAAANNVGGLSTMSWTTMFTGLDPIGNPVALPAGGLIGLPWGDWLTTLGTTTATTAGADTYRVKNTSNYVLSGMSFSASTPGEALQESRIFAGVAANEQMITNQQLTVGGAPFTRADNLTVAGTVMPYMVIPAATNPNGPAGFQYQFVAAAGAVTESIDAAFYVLGNSITPGTTGEIAGHTGIAYNDIWAALGSSMTVPGTTTPMPQDIGANNLEMRFSNALGTTRLAVPKDIIYIPLANMNWLK